MEWPCNHHPSPSLYYVTSPVPLKAFASFHKSTFLEKCLGKKSLFLSRIWTPSGCVAHKCTRKGLFFFCCVEKDSSKEQADGGLSNNALGKGQQSKNRKQVDWEDIDEVVDGGFLNKFRQEYMEGRASNLSDGSFQDLGSDKKKRSSRSFPQRVSSFKSQQTLSMDDNLNSSSVIAKKSEDNGNSKDDSVHDISLVDTEADSENISKSTYQDSSDTPQPRKSSLTNRRKRKNNNMFVYNMHLQQSKDSNNYSSSVTHVPDEFCEAKVLADEKAFNRMAPSNFVRVEPWRWKHFPYQERFQRLVKPESKMWIKRTNSKDIQSLSVTESTTNMNSSSRNTTRHSSSTKAVYHERKKKSTQWRKMRADSLSENI
ncbi:hypothetical protein GpartN1_g7691.t1 [Galdieria partita]|uniref:Uncharacterized protein n=1 Tax=Galdieria partita TaxID=83374 RepID=A0A9C7Q5A5_9RHOD|nr:hypothetical protein GpartN1_g7691.t1 [Galdieria partita]